MDYGKKNHGEKEGMTELERISKILCPREKLAKMTAALGERKVKHLLSEDYYDGARTGTAFVNSLSKAQKMEYLKEKAVFVNVLEVSLGPVYKTLLESAVRTSRPFDMWNTVQNHYMEQFNSTSAGSDRDRLLASKLSHFDNVMPDYLNSVTELQTRVNQLEPGSFNDKAVIGIMKGGIANATKRGSLYYDAVRDIN